jgi:Protein of unknown function (DUF1353)
MSKFLSELDARLLNDDTIWALDSDLVYQSDLLNCIITVPKDFQTDFASVPRWIPIASNALIDKAHREAVLHDYLYRIDSIPVVTESKANSLFLEAMTLRAKPWFIRHAMYWGVCLGGFTAFHKLKVNDSLI